MTAGMPSGWISCTETSSAAVILPWANWVTSVTGTRFLDKWVPQARRVLQHPPGRLHAWG